MNVVLLLIYVVHPSGSDVLETSSSKMKTCGMYESLKKKKDVHSLKIVFFSPLLNNLFSVFK